MVDGFFNVDVAPLPKSQNQSVGEPIDWSVNATTSGEHPATGSAVKLGNGACAFAQKGSQRHTLSNRIKLRINFLPVDALVKRDFQFGLVAAKWQKLFPNGEIRKLFFLQAVIKNKGNGPAAIYQCVN